MAQIPLTFLSTAAGEFCFALVNKTQVRAAMGSEFDVDRLVDQAVATGSAGIGEELFLLSGHLAALQTPSAGRSPQITLWWFVTWADGSRAWQYDVVTRATFASRWGGTPADFEAVRSREVTIFRPIRSPINVTWGEGVPVLSDRLEAVPGLANDRIAWMRERVEAANYEGQQAPPGGPSEVDFEQDHGWPVDDGTPFGPASDKVQALIDRASKLTKAEGNALGWAQSETRIGQMFAEPWHDSAERRRQLTVTSKVETMISALPESAWMWSERARDAAEAAVGRSPARSTAAGSYVGELAQALVVGDRLHQGDIAALFHVWDVVIKQRNPTAFPNPENAAYRRAGSCVAPCFSIVLLMVGLGGVVTMVFARIMRRG